MSKNYSKILLENKNTETFPAILLKWRGPCREGDPSLTFSQGGSSHTLKSGRLFRECGDVQDESSTTTGVVLAPPPSDSPWYVIDAVSLVVDTRPPWSLGLSLSTPVPPLLSQDSVIHSRLAS